MVRNVDKPYFRNIPGAWTGPLAGVDEPASPTSVSNRWNHYKGTIGCKISHFRGRVSSSSSSSSSSQLSQDALIAQILSSIQPKITSAVQGAISSSAQNARRTVQVQVPVVAAPRPTVLVAAPRPIAPR